MGATDDDPDRSARGPGRPSLVEPDDIVDAATAVIERDGLEGFSMRSLARELGVWPTTLYHHFENRDAVLDAVADRFLGSVSLPPPTGVPWQEWLEQFATAVRATWVAHPRLLAVVMVRPGRGTSIAAMLDGFLGVLRASGFTAEVAHGAWHAVQNHLFGEVYQLASWGPGGRARPDGTGPADRDADAHPTIAAWRDTLVACDRDAQFRIGIRTIVRGLEATVADG